MLRHLFIALTATFALGAVATSASAQDAIKPPDYPFSFESPLGGYDMPAVQRGFAVYRQICSNCHSMNALSYRNLGEEGGPFAAYRVRDEATGEEKMQIGLHAGQHGRLLDIKDNAYVRAIAAGVQIADIDHDTGAANERPGTPSVPERNRRARGQWRGLAARSFGDHLGARGWCGLCALHSHRLHWRTGWCSISQSLLSRHVDLDAAASLGAGPRALR